MSDRAAFPFRTALIAAALTLSACDRSGDDSELAGLDNQILANDSDPALTSALEDQILVDPSLSQRSNRLAVREARRPGQAQYPTGAGRAIAATGDETRCGAKFDYGLGWARRMPAEFPVYPGAKITEAAGNDAGDCSMRVVSYTSSETPRRLINWYNAKATAAGYSAEEQARGGDLILAGAEEAGEGAYYLIVTPLKNGGSDVALIANKGR